MEKLFDILCDFYILIIGDTIPDYILIAINWVCFGSFCLIIGIPVIILFGIISLFTRKRGGFYD